MATVVGPSARGPREPARTAPPPEGEEKSRAAPFYAKVQASDPTNQAAALRTPSRDVDFGSLLSPPFAPIPDRSKATSSMRYKKRKELRSDPPYALRSNLKKKGASVAGCPALLLS